MFIKAAAPVRARFALRGNHRAAGPGREDKTASRANLRRNVYRRDEILSHNGGLMSAIRYPVAANAERALSAPLGRAARESEAVGLAGGEVRFVSEPAGPAFDTHDAALAAWKELVDEARAIAPEDRFCALREVMVRDGPKKSRLKPARPVFKEGKRWSTLPEPPRTVWRLSVSYWRAADAAERAALEQARKIRRKAAAQVDAATLRALARQPLLPVRPQQPLDIGLFEYRLPEAPHIIVPDE